MIIKLHLEKKLFVPRGVFAAAIALGIVMGYGGLAHAQCSVDAHCPGAQICEGGNCVEPSAPEPLNVTPGCASDVECKGDRICADGKCVDVVQQPQPAPLPAAQAPAYHQAPPPAAQGQAYYPAPQQQPYAPVAPGVAVTGSAQPIRFFEKGYGVMTGMMAFHGWGGFAEEGEESYVWDEDGEIENDFWGGLYLAGMAAVSPNFHVGGYWTFATGDGTSSYDNAGYGESDFSGVANSLGLSMKFGGQAGSRIWIGGGVDLGVVFQKYEVYGGGATLESNPIVGLWTYPRFNMDIMLFNAGAFKMAATVAIGAVVIPIMGGHPLDSDDYGNIDEISTRVWSVSPTMLIGLVMGG